MLYCSLRYRSPWWSLRYTTSVRTLAVGSFSNGAPAAPLSQETLRLIDIFVVNEVEASFYSGVKIGSLRDAEREVRRMCGQLGNICVFHSGQGGGAWSVRAIAVSIFRR